MENTNSKMHKNDNSYVLSALSYLSIFFAPIILPLLVWILAEEPTSEHGKKALGNHVITWISFFIISRAAFIFSKEVFDKPFDHQLLIFVIALIIAIVFFLIALILYILNIIRGIKILLKK
ncbi:DUF4870 domain-containing protein [Staphylococcus hominis]|uniref:DUF4870 domain-containing protein n=1 Tax=Staphylococcus hominis TaxID=1290 RepID=UPI0012DE655C|nr:DUF4870 domain-containing protein [Staphylococcus hominis]MDS0981675.1 DUF4870 domain-containing protein [Staphylococcus hominis]QGR79330.1 DUF4870 domain-containing protein [Staphylococcus hominis]